MHARTWQANRYVYPVVSRRSKGISLGINLNPDKACNFDCIYCSVDRTTDAGAALPREIDLGILREELSEMLEVARSGRLYAFDPFDNIPEALRRINDIAFSGDGEPTTCPQFDEAVKLAAELAGSFAESIKLVLITNATMLQKPAVRETLAFLDGHNGEIWAKLDAGTEPYYHLVDRTHFPFERVLENLLWCCQTRPTVIQSLFMRIHGAAPVPEEITAYVQRLSAIGRAGGRLKLVQLYTVARRPAELYCTPLTAAELAFIAQDLGAALPGVPVEIYP